MVKRGDCIRDIPEFFFIMCRKPEPLCSFEALYMFFLFDQVIMFVVMNHFVEGMGKLFVRFYLKCNIEPTDNH